MLCLTTLNNFVKSDKHLNAYIYTCKSIIEHFSKQAIPEMTKGMMINWPAIDLSPNLKELNKSRFIYIVASGFSLTKCFDISFALTKI